MTTTAPSQQPGFGYVIVDHAQAASFTSLGDYFNISYLPKKLPENMEGLKICLWLGPGILDGLEIVVLLIYPGRGIISLNPALSATQPSLLVTLGRDTGGFLESVAPNVIAHELLNINTDPCLLFIRWTDPYTLIEAEARKLSFATLVLEVVNECMTYLQGRGIRGDAVESTALADWFASTTKEFDDAGREKFLFDPTILLVGIMGDLGQALSNAHQFDINREPCLLIPLIFIREWNGQLMDRLLGPEKDETIRALLQYSN